MKREDVQPGQRIRINLPGAGDHGHIGTVKRIRGSVCSVHMDRDQRSHHVVVVYANDVDLLADDTLTEATLVDQALVV
jgi:hypothetical protein